MYFFVKSLSTYAIYHSRARGLILRDYKRGRWQADRVLAKDARENFTAHVDNGIIYIFCQDGEGDIVLITYKESDAVLTARVVLKNQNNRVQNIILYPIILNNGLTIIYNQPSPEERCNYLTTQTMTENGEWSAPTRIDKNWSNSFEVQRVTDDHLLIFYQTRTTENNLGYRELTPDRQGHFNIFYTTNYFVSDTAYLTTDNGIHTLFAVKSMFSCQLIYRRNISGEFGNPFVIYEAQRIEKCLLFFVHNKLHITFLAGGQLYMCVSEDKGSTFSRPARYRNKFCQIPEKAYYIGQTPQSEESLFLRQIYVDRSCPWDTQIIPDIYEDFYGGVGEQAVEIIEQHLDNNESMEELRIQRNQVEILRKSIEEKDNQIVELTRLVKQRTEELNELTLRQRAFMEKIGYSSRNNSRRANPSSFSAYDENPPDAYYDEEYKQDTSESYYTSQNQWSKPDSNEVSETDWKRLVETYSAKDEQNMFYGNIRKVTENERKPSEAAYTSENERKPSEAAYTSENERSPETSYASENEQN
ncbi:MAG: hypothetical protein LBQ68_05490 [Clostridiales bacterium]|jgi:hypothetical protein|nr:hypothetical protein [Clostridiales bacterium]